MLTDILETLRSEYMLNTQTLPKLKELIKKIEKATRVTELNEVVQETRSFLGYDHIVYRKKGEFPQLEWFLGKKDNEKKKLLGQVQTPPEIADLIVELCVHSSTDKVLDPCCGDGVFLLSSLKKLKYLASDRKSSFINQIYGVEIDPEVFTKGLEKLGEFSDSSKLQNLYNGDFFDVKNLNGYVDVGVMNPPYIRQEDLTNKVSFLNKTEIKRKCLEGSDIRISNKSNIYVYFFIYLTKLLKEGGWLGAITSNTWLDTDFGKDLQKFLLDRFHIKYVIDFAKDVFPQAAVESCIVVMQKMPSQSLESETTKFVHIKRKISLLRMLELLGSNQSFENDDIRVVVMKQKDLAVDSKWGKYLYAPAASLKILNSQWMVPLSSLAEIYRGFTSHWNKFFKPSDETISASSIEKQYLTDIIKSPKDISCLNTLSGVKLSRILMVRRGKDELKALGQDEILKYINDWEKLLLEQVKKRSLKDKILNGDNGWFILHPQRRSPIIFSYTIRKSKHFILNSGNYITQDNFYNIAPRNNDQLMLLFGVLNSTVTKLLIEISGRRHGRGLLKMQVYEMKNLPVLDIQRIPLDFQESIASLSKELSKAGLKDTNTQNHIIHQIDSMILKILDVGISVNDLTEMERVLVAKRIQREKPLMPSEIIGD